MIAMNGRESMIAILQGLGLIAILWVIAGEFAEDGAGNRPWWRRVIAFVGIIIFLAATLWISQNISYQ